MFKKSISTTISCLVVAAANFIPVTAQAQSITFSRAITAGSGCRNNKQVISPDGQTVSILLDKFIAENRKKVLCNVKIRADIPDGFYLEKVDVTYQGFRDIKKGETGFFQTTYSGASKTGRGVDLKFREGTDIFIAQAPFLIRGKKSSCKRAKTDIAVKMIAFASKDSQVALDTVDLQAGKLVLDFEVLPCQPKGKKN